jgi:predicted nucleotidyltransferase
MKKTAALLAPSNAVKVLYFMSDFPGKDFVSGGIQKATGLSKMGDYLALKELEREGFLQSAKIGKTFIYRINHKNPVLKQMKTVKNVSVIVPLVDKLKEYSEKIILFGSASRGEDSFGSDYDLFILTRDKEEVQAVLDKFKSARKVQAKIMGAVEFSNLKSSDRVFYDEVIRGITLWESERN